LAIDYWKLVQDFEPGDCVQKFMPGRSALSPYVGRVTSVMRGIGFLDVQWPFGNERVSPEDVVKINPDLLLYLPPQLNSSYYPGLDAFPAKTASGEPLWRSTLPIGFHLKLARLFHRRASEVQAYDVLWHSYRQADDESIRDEVSKFYKVAHNLVTILLLEQARKKDAAYWAATDRKYRATRQELDSRQVDCPKCKQGPMRKATYKMEGGQRVRLLACPQCMHLVKQTDILGPGGEAVQW